MSANSPRYLAWGYFIEKTTQDLPTMMPSPLFLIRSLVDKSTIFLRNPVSESISSGQIYYFSQKPGFFA
ncbi:hypothetical protein [Microseira wollei]|uniref:hypothetical protein n=1 Tax=Microseira wollei TaxID=467598 RepID=UPI001CFD028B|nr:hypothetical protein [Microseira wollei]